MSKFNSSGEIYGTRRGIPNLLCLSVWVRSPLPTTQPFASFYRELVQWMMVSTLENVWPLFGLTMWLDRDEETFVFALVSPLAERNLKLSYMDWRSLKPETFANYVSGLPCPVRCS